MYNKLSFFFSRMKEKLWIKPLITCTVSLMVALLAIWFDNLTSYYSIQWIMPEIKQKSIEQLLKITASSMLVISTFSVASMVSAYASTASTATPRAFPLMIADDLTQNALSVFIGSFIYSLVALIALMNEYYSNSGRFIIFCATLLMLIIVILTFLRWVDRIARLGRLGTTIDKVEKATEKALIRRRLYPFLGGVPLKNDEPTGEHISPDSIGYIQNINMNDLQEYAEEHKLYITILGLPGTFVGPGRSIAIVSSDSNQSLDIEFLTITKCFTIGPDRVFDQDPRFGLVVLSEIASRALSPAVNDPGTAIDIINTLVRLFSTWVEPPNKKEIDAPLFDRIHVPKLSLSDMFDDAFCPISRDGAALSEVQIRLQKSFKMLYQTNDGDVKNVVNKHAREALLRAENADLLPKELNEITMHMQSFLRDK